MELLLEAGARCSAQDQVGKVRQELRAAEQPKPGFYCPTLPTLTQLIQALTRAAEQEVEMICECKSCLCCLGVKRNLHMEARWFG